MAEPRNNLGLMRLSRAQTKDSVQRSEYLGFRLDCKAYGIPIEKVGEILRIPPITPVPRSNNRIMGVVSVRGKVLTLLDLRTPLGLHQPPTTRQSRILVLPWSNHDSVGLYVDEVLQVYRLGKEEIELTAKGTASELGDHVMGMAKMDGAIVVILQLDSFLDL